MSNDTVSTQPAPYIITDGNGDGTIGGADFGAYLLGHTVQHDPSTVTVKPGASTALASAIAQQIGQKSIVLLGETHYLNATAVLLETVKALAPSGKPVTICTEYEPDSVATSFALLNAASPESLSNAATYDAIVDAYLQDVCNGQNRRTGGSFTLDDAKRIAKRNPQVAADLADFKNLIACRALGAKIVAVDMNNRTAESAHDEAREKTLTDNIIAQVDPNGVTLCLLGALHCSKNDVGVGTTWAHINPVGKRLDTQYGTDAVLHVQVIPEVQDAMAMHYSLRSALNMPPVEGDQPTLEGSLAPSDFDLFLYHDAR